MDVYEKFKKDLMWTAFWFIIYVTVFTAVLDYFKFAWDDSDGETRSNLNVHTDARTGCQYLSTLGGGITPRYAADGTHICSKE